jgi:branched-chain amino acid transport system substrate-binding protein
MTSAADPFVIPVIVSQTGTAAFIGKSEAEGVQTLERLVNQAGGIQGQPIHFDIHDDASNPAQTVQLFNEINATHPAVIIGPSLAATCSALAPLIASGPLVYCLSAGVHPPLGSYLFSAFFSSIDMVAASARFFKQRGWTKVASITSTDAGGQDGQAAFEAAFGSDAGLAIVDRERFNATDLSVAAQMERIKASGAQGLVAWSTGTPFATILRGAVDAGLKIPIVPSTGNLTYGQMAQYRDYLKSVDLYFAAAPFIASAADIDERVVRRTVETYQSAFRAVGVRPDVAQAVGWDPPLLIIDALKHLGTKATATQIRDYIANISPAQNVVGVFGKYDFKLYAQRGLGLNQVVIVRWDAARDAFVTVGKGR